MATTAAPTYLAALIACEMSTSDSPMVAFGRTILSRPAVAEARSMLKVPLDAVGVLSLGTTGTVADNPARLNKGGVFQWLRGNSLVDVLLRGQSSGATGLAQHLVGHANLIRADTMVPPQFCHLDRADTRYSARPRIWRRSQSDPPVR